MSVQELTGMTEGTAARFCQSAHTQLIELLMGTVDLVDAVQRQGRDVDVAKLRRKLGPEMRRLDGEHATALSALVIESDAEYADELITHAEEIG